MCKSGKYCSPHKEITDIYEIMILTIPNTIDFMPLHLLRIPYKIYINFLNPNYFLLQILLSFISVSLPDSIDQYNKEFCLH